jgi:hypothetical protein
MWLRRVSSSGRHDFQPRALPAELPRCWALCSLRKLRKISPSRTVIPYNWRVGAQLYRDFLSFQEGGRQAWSSASGSSVDELWSRCGSLTLPQFPRMRSAGVVCSPRLGHCRFDERSGVCARGHTGDEDKVSCHDRSAFLEFLLEEHGRPAREGCETCPIDLGSIRHSGASVGAGEQISNPGVGRVYPGRLRRPVLWQIVRITRLPTYLGIGMRRLFACCWANNQSTGSLTGTPTGVPVRGRPAIEAIIRGHPRRLPNEWATADPCGL